MAATHITMLGIDPGVERVGYGVVRKEGSRLVFVACGLIQTPRIELGERLTQIHREVGELLATHQPDAMVNERLFFTKNVTTAIDVAQALGCVRLAAAQAGIVSREITPPEVKQAVVGTGRADKRQIQFMITRLLGLNEPPQPDDVADALAVAVAGLLMAPLPRVPPR